MRRCAMILALCGAVGCGGKHKAADTGPTGGGDDSSEGDDTASSDDGMVAPETMEEIQHDLDRHRQTATRCLTKAIDDGEAKKNAAGKITLEMVIGKNGRAKDINVVNTTIDSQQFQDCVVAVVADISFPTLPKDMDWSYTYAFEAF